MEVRCKASHHEPNRNGYLCLSRSPCHGRKKKIDVILLCMGTLIATLPYVVMTMALEINDEGVDGNRLLNKTQFCDFVG